MKQKIHRLHYLLYAAPLLFARPIFAQSVDTRPAGFAGFSTQDLKVTIENIVRLIVGFLGIITIIIILAGGFKWMTSLGNEDKIADAKKLITAGVVGLVLVLAAYAIAIFVINSLLEAV